MNASGKDYLRAVYFLSAEEEATRVSDIAQALCVSRPSVSNALKKLLAQGFVEHERYGDVRLTPKGRKAAEELIRAYERLRLRLS